MGFVRSMQWASRPLEILFNPKAPPERIIAHVVSCLRRETVLSHLGRHASSHREL